MSNQIKNAETKATTESQVAAAQTGVVKPSVSTKASAKLAQEKAAQALTAEALAKKKALEEEEAEVAQAEKAAAEARADEQASEQASADASGSLVVEEEALAEADAAALEEIEAVAKQIDDAAAGLDMASRDLGMMFAQAAGGTAAAGTTAGISTGAIVAGVAVVGAAAAASGGSDSGPGATSSGSSSTTTTSGTLQASGLSTTAFLSPTFATLAAPAVGAAAPVASLTTTGGSTVFLATKTAVASNFANASYNTTGLINAYGSASTGNDEILLSTANLSAAFTAATSAAAASAPLLEGTLIDGKAGTDLLILSLTSDITANTTGVKSANLFTENVEVIAVTNATTAGAPVAVTVNAKNFDGVQEVWHLESANAGVVFADVASTATRFVISDTAQATTIGFAEDADVEGGAVVTVVADETRSGASLTVNTTNLEDLNVTTLRVSSNGNATSNVLSVTETGGSTFENLVLFGSKGMTIGSLSMSGLEKVDASGLTGNLDLTLTSGQLNATTPDIIAGAGSANKVSATVVGDGAISLTRVQTLALAQSTAGTVDLDGTTGLNTVTLSGSAVGAASFSNVAAGVSFTSSGTVTNTETSITFKELGDLNFSLTGTTTASTIFGLRTENARVISLSNSSTQAATFGDIAASDDVRALNVTNSGQTGGSLTVGNFAGNGTEAFVANLTTADASTKTTTAGITAGNLSTKGDLYVGITSVEGAISAGSATTSAGVAVAQLNATSANATLGNITGQADVSVTTDSRATRTSTVGSLLSRAEDVVIDVTVRDSTDTTNAAVATANIANAGTIVSALGRVSIAATSGIRGDIFIASAGTITSATQDVFVNVAAGLDSDTRIGNISANSDIVLGVKAGATYAGNANVSNADVGTLTAEEGDINIAVSAASRAQITVGLATARVGDISVDSIDFGNVARGNSGVVNTSVADSASVALGGLTASGTGATVSVGTASNAIDVASEGTFTSGAISANSDVVMYLDVAERGLGGSGTGAGIESTSGTVVIESLSGADASDFTSGAITGRDGVTVSVKTGNNLPNAAGTPDSDITMGLVSSAAGSISLGLDMGRGADFTVAGVQAAQDSVALTLTGAQQITGIISADITARKAGETAVDFNLSLGSGSTLDNAAANGFNITAAAGDVSLITKIESSAAAVSTIEFGNIAATSGAVSLSGESSFGASSNITIGQTTAGGGTGTVSIGSSSDKVTVGSSALVTTNLITGSKDVSVYLEQAANSKVDVNGLISSTGGSVTIESVENTAGSRLDLTGVTALNNVEIDFRGAFIQTGALTAQSDSAAVNLDAAVLASAASTGALTVGSIAASDTNATIVATLSAGNLSDINVAGADAHGNISFGITTGQGTANSVGPVTSTSGDVLVAASVESSATGASTLSFTSLTASGTGSDVVLGTSSSKLTVKESGVLNAGNLSGNASVSMFVDLAQNAQATTGSVASAAGGITLNAISTNSGVDLLVNNTVTARGLVDVDFQGGTGSTVIFNTASTVTSQSDNIDFDLAVGALATAGTAIGIGNMTATGGGKTIDVTAVAGRNANIDLGTATAGGNVNYAITTGAGTTNTADLLTSNAGSVNVSATVGGNLTMGGASAVGAGGTVNFGTSANAISVAAGDVTFSTGAANVTAQSNIGIYASLGAGSTLAAGTSNLISSTNGTVTVNSVSGSNGSVVTIAGGGNGAISGAAGVDIDITSGVGGVVEITSTGGNTLASATGSIDVDIIVGRETDAAGNAGGITIGGPIAAVVSGPQAGTGGGVDLTLTAGDGAIINVASASTIQADASVNINITTGESNDSANIVGTGGITSNNADVLIRAQVNSSGAAGTANATTLTFGSLTSTQGDVKVNAASEVQEGGVLNIGAVTANAQGGEFLFGAVNAGNVIDAVVLGADSALNFTGAIGTRSGVTILASTDVGADIDFASTVGATDGRVSIYGVGTSGVAPAAATLSVGGAITAGESVDIDFIAGAAGVVSVSALTAVSGNVDLNLAVGNFNAVGGITQAGAIAAQSVNSSVIIDATTGFQANLSIATATTITAGKDVNIDVSVGESTTSGIAATSTITANNGSITFSGQVNSANGGASALTVGRLVAIEGNSNVEAGNVTITGTRVGASGTLTFGGMDATGVGTAGPDGRNVVIGSDASADVVGAGAANDRVVLEEDADLVTGALLAERNVQLYAAMDAKSTITTTTITANNGTVTVSALGGKADTQLTTNAITSEGTTKVRFEGGFDSKVSLGNVRAFDGNIDLDLIVGNEDGTANATNITVGSLEATGTDATINVLATAGNGAQVSIASGASIIADQDITFAISVGEGIDSGGGTDSDSTVAQTVISNRGDISVRAILNSSNSSNSEVSNSNLTFGTLTANDGDVTIVGSDFINGVARGTWVGTDGDLVFGAIVAGISVPSSTEGNISIGSGARLSGTDNGTAIVASDAVNVQFGGARTAASTGETTLFQTGSLTAANEISVYLDIEAGADVTIGSVQSVRDDVTISVTNDAGALAGPGATESGLVTIGNISAAEGTAVLSLATSTTVVPSVDLSIGTITADRVVIHFTGSGSEAGTHRLTQGGNFGVVTAEVVGAGSGSYSTGRINDAIYYRLQGSAPVTLTQAGNVVQTGSTTYIDARGLTGGLTAEGSANGANTFVLNGGTNALTGGTTWSDTYIVLAGSGSSITNLEAPSSGTNIDVLQVSAGASATAAILDTKSFIATSNTNISGTATFNLGATATIDLRSASVTGSTRIVSGGTASTISVDEGSNTITTGAGTNTLNLNGGTSNTVTLAGGNTVNVTAGSNNTITTGSGTDLFNISGGTNTIRSMATATDRVTVSSGSGTTVTLASDGILQVSSGATVTLTEITSWTLAATSSVAGAVVVTARTSGTTIDFGTNGNVTATGSVDFNGSSGADSVTVDGGTGNDLNGGGGNDTLKTLSGVGTHTLTGGTGDDTFDIAGGTVTITDLSNNDVLKVANTAVTVAATVTGNWTAGATSVNSDAVGHVVISAGIYDVDLDAAAAGSGFTVTSTGGDITGSDDGDKLELLSGTATFAGGTGNDTFTATSGTLTVSDLGVADILIRDGGTIAATVVANWSATAATTNDGTAADVVIDVDGAFTVSLASVNTGNGYTVESTGTGAVTGSNYADILQNTSGSATFNGGTGNDTFTAIADVMTVSDLATGDIARVTGTGSLVATSTGFVATAGTYNLGGALADFQITASGASVTIDLSLSAGGNAGFTVIGSGNADVLIGSGLADKFDGGAGADTMTGGAGADEFVFDGTPSTDTGITVATADRIIGFTSGSDKISGMGVAGTGAGEYQEDAAGEANFADALVDANAAFAAANALSYYFTHDTTTGDGYLFINDDNNATADAVIVFTSLTAAGFAAGDIIA